MNEELIKAIRAITVDMPDGKPNGEVERLICLLSYQLCELPSCTEYNDVIQTCAELCHSIADSNRRLRVSAEAYFGGDFNTPTAEELAAGKAGV